jgi:hypothetical protein
MERSPDLLYDPAQQFVKQYYANAKYGICENTQTGFAN